MYALFLLSLIKQKAYGKSIAKRAATVDNDDQEESAVHFDQSDDIDLDKLKSQLSLLSSRAADNDYYELNDEFADDEDDDLFENLSSSNSNDDGKIHQSTTTRI